MKAHVAHTVPRRRSKDRIISQYHIDAATMANCRGAYHLPRIAASPRVDSQPETAEGLTTPQRGQRQSRANIRDNRTTWRAPVPPQRPGARRRLRQSPRGPAPPRCRETQHTSASIREETPLAPTQHVDAFHNRDKGDERRHCNRRSRDERGREARAASRTATGGDVLREWAEDPRATTGPNGPRTPVFKYRRREIRVGVEWKTHVAEVLQTLAREARRFDDMIGCRGFQCAILGPSTSYFFKQAAIFFQRQDCGSLVCDRDDQSRSPFTSVNYQPRLGSETGPVSGFRSTSLVGPARASARPRPTSLCIAVPLKSARLVPSALFGKRSWRPQAGTDRSSRGAPPRREPLFLAGKHVGHEAHGRLGHGCVASFHLPPTCGGPL